MAELALAQLAVDPSSYVDPNGFVFAHGGEILRAIRPEREAFYRGLLSDGSVGRLIKDHGLVETEISDYTIPEIACRLVLRHARVSPLSYCVEWCPSMLRDAARATLELALALLPRGCFLQDAYPWNVLFSGTRPVFVDFTSIVPAETPLLWPAHQQFMDFFLNPLELCRMGKGKVARGLLYDPIEGINSADVIAERTPGYVLRHPLRALGERAAARLSARIQKSSALKQRLQAASHSERFAVRDANLRERFFTRLLRRVEKIRIREAEDTWRDYYAGVTQVTQSDEKARRVASLLEALRPDTVLDLGCNVGRYSVLAAQCGARVRSIDGSEHCIEALYRKAKTDGLDITPVVANALSPTPAFGFLGRQFPGLVERFRSDVVLCLGLMHHLHMNGRQSFERIAAMLRELAARAVIFEYVAMDDDNIHLLDCGRPINYSLASVSEALSRHFKLQTFESDRPTRRILVCEK